MVNRAAFALLCLTACNALLGNERRVYDPSLEPAPNQLFDAGIDGEAGAPQEPAPSACAEADSGECDDPCQSLRCGLHARCERMPTARCVCSDGYEGDGGACNKPEPCRNITCQNGGRCVQDEHGARCDCSGTGFEGSACQTERDLCAPNPCLHGTCAAESGIAFCTCERGFRGAHCDEPDPCADNPCGNRGTCNPDVGTKLCTCKEGWEGDLCNVSSCNGLKCNSSTTCERPSGKQGFCYPKDCAGKTGLCLAVNSDGSGRASTELLTERNDSFNFNEGTQTGNNWNSIPRYFAYLSQHGNYKVACVYPQGKLSGTPLEIPLGTHATTLNGFGQSNDFTTGGKCPVK